MALGAWLRHDQGIRGVLGLGLVRGVLRDEWIHSSE